MSRHAAWPTAWRGWAGAAALALAACGGGSESDGGGQPQALGNGSPVLFSVGGVVNGLVGTGLVLRNSSGERLAVEAGGGFVFPTMAASGSTYAVDVAAAPSAPAQQCTVADATGTLAAANVGNIVVTCATSSFAVGGTVTGLSGSIVLQLNGGNDRVVAADGSFAFAGRTASASAYAVTVRTQPAGQVCSVVGGIGAVAAANVASVRIACVALPANTFTVGGTVQGLAGSGLVLRNSDGSVLAVAANGGFVFPVALPNSTAYAVTVATQPTMPVQTCVVANGSGRLAGAGVVNVVVTCSTVDPTNQNTPLPSGIRRVSTTFFSLSSQGHAPRIPNSTLSFDGVAHASGAFANPPAITFGGATSVTVFEFVDGRRQVQYGGPPLMFSATLPQANAIAAETYLLGYGTIAASDTFAIAADGQSGFFTMTTVFRGVPMRSRVSITMAGPGTGWIDLDVSAPDQRLGWTRIVAGRTTQPITVTMKTIVSP